jgi:outer membrane protein assembly factor BamD (BamD/ComL family)
MPGVLALRRLRAAVFGSLFLAASGSLALAPFQCASKVDPNKTREEEPGEALYGLAEQFRAKGDQKARAETLRYLIQKYPTSRFAEQARLDLGEAEDAAKTEK